jgi:ACR3 family arsenite efflux pump ArsB
LQLVFDDPATGKRYLIPRVKLAAVDSYSKTKTQDYDEIATSHLLFVVMPLMVGYAAYSLVHERHKSWYSWILTSLTGFVYVFGFVMMTPQLFINYKLRSVAHLPWRTMVSEPGGVQGGWWQTRVQD